MGDGKARTYCVHIPLLRLVILLAYGGKRLSGEGYTSYWSD